MFNQFVLSDMISLKLVNCCFGARSFLIPTKHAPGFNVLVTQRANSYANVINPNHVLMNPATLFSYIIDSTSLGLQARSM